MYVLFRDNLIIYIFIFVKLFLKYIQNLLIFYHFCIICIFFRTRRTDIFRSQLFTSPPSTLSGVSIGSGDDNYISRAHKTGSMKGPLSPVMFGRPSSIISGGSVSKGTHAKY